MNLEWLPNEILLIIFDHLESTDLLYAFYDLNYRFNHLIRKQYYQYCFNFKSVSKRTFDMICHQHLPFITDRIIALHLDNNGVTPGQTDLFLSYTPSFAHFTHLRSLSFRSISSYEMLMNILDQCDYLANLIYLKFISCEIHDANTDDQLIINKIWGLKKLTHCAFGISNTMKSMRFHMPEVISTSIKDLWISNHQNKIRLNQLNSFFEYTPHLRYLSTCAALRESQNYLASTFPSLLVLNVKITDVCSDLQIRLFLTSFPSLCRLTINIWWILIDGHQWENIIHHHLPNLQVFRLKMNQSFFSVHGITERAKTLLTSFQSPFWIDRHQWFVRCLTFNKLILLCTLSHKYTDIMMTFPDSFNSTCPQDDLQQFYNDIKNIYNHTLFERSNSSDFQLPNIERLNIKMPINDRFWSIVRNLYRLTSLTILSYADIHYDQLQMIFDRSPNLRFLRIHQDNLLPCQMSLFKSKSVSFDILRLKGQLRQFNQYFNQDECVVLTSSEIVAKCEQMSICVLDRESIVYLIQTMANLKILYVECKDDPYFNSTSISRRDDAFLAWLSDHLPSCMIRREVKNKSAIEIWIDH
ncbi:hypothetical protein I4U23_020086 [Adineta vaga]|nr:hypothetical protein I4U23_020086 [Adineta vaga]